MRTPLSKQRNKHIQRVLVEAAKLAPRQDHDLALVYEREKQKGNANRVTLAVARKMVAYLLAVDRGQRDFVPFQITTPSIRPPHLSNVPEPDELNASAVAVALTLFVFRDQMRENNVGRPPG